MHGVWLYSYLILWAVTIALGICTLALLRMIGQLYLRIGPTGAMAVQTGPQIGEPLFTLQESPSELAPALQEIFQFPKSKDTMVLFLSQNCSACKELMTSFIPFQLRFNNRMQAVVVLDGTEASFAQMLEHTTSLVLESRELFSALRITGTPFAIWIDRHGIVRAKGIVNHMEHLESLVNASDTGFATLDAYVTSLDVAEPKSLSSTRH